MELLKDIVTGCVFGPIAYRVYSAILLILFVGWLYYGVKIARAPHANITIRGFDEIDNFSQFKADVTISTKNTKSLIIREISLDFFHNGGPTNCSPRTLTFLQRDLSPIMITDTPFHGTIVFGIDKNYTKSALSSLINKSIEPEIILKYTTETGEDKVLFEKFGTIQIYTNYAGFGGVFRGPINIPL